MTSDNKPTQDRWHCVNMPKQDPEKRVCNFDEVALGYNEEQAQREASRCLLCNNPQCSKGCPIGINVPAFIKLLKDKKYEQALKKIKEKSSFPVITCRICPQEVQCQRSCMVAKKGEAVQVGRLERFLADLEKNKQIDTSSIRPSLSTGKKVAVIVLDPQG